MLVDAAHRQNGVSIVMPGRFGNEHRLRGWPNLVEIANRAIGHFNEIADPDLNYMAYVGGSLGFRTPCFTRSLWDWTEAASYGLTGRIAARRLTGNLSGEKVEIGQRQLTLACFFNLDGFCHRGYARGWSEDTSVVLWEQGRTLFTLMSWFLENEDERLLDYVRGLLRALREVSRLEGNQRRFDNRFSIPGHPFTDVSPMILVEPLIKYYEVTTDSDALEFCEDIINWAVDPETNFVDEDCRFSGWLRSLAAGLAGIVRYATTTADDALLDHCERMFRSAAGLTTRFGATPDTEPCCTNMELTTSAIALARNGYSEWWDLVDRHFRNHTIACQFTDPDGVEIGYIEKDPEPADDIRNIVQRSLGGFTWSSAREHLFERAKLMLCCGGNAMWTMGKIVDHAVSEIDNGVQIDLHFSVDTLLASIANHEPFEGKLEVTPKRDGVVRIRKPAYAAAVEATVDDSRVVPKVNGDYLSVDFVRAGSRICLSYELPESTTVERTMESPYAGEDKGRGSFARVKSDPVVFEEIQTTWRGNTVLAIDYESESPHPKHRLYLDRMRRFQTCEGRDAVERFFLPERPFSW